MLLVLLSYTACTKIENKDRVIYGQIVDSVSVPIQNKKFLMVVSTTTTSIGAGNGFTTDEAYPFNTDANGLFKISFKAKKNASANICLPKETMDNTFYYGIDVSKDLEINTGIVKMPRR